MSETLAAVLVFLTILVVATLNHLSSPHCRWCNWRHRGRCIYNPRAGKVFANVNDGHFDYNDPNK